MDNDELFNAISNKLEPLLHTIAEQEGFPQQVCALYCITNIAGSFSLTQALGILEHAKHMILRKQSNPEDEYSNTFSFIS